MNTHPNNNGLIEIMPLQPKKVKLEAGEYPGRFANVRLDDQPKRDNSPRKDLVITVQLDKQEDGQPVMVDHVFNLLPRKRGVSHFKNSLKSYLKHELSAQELAGFNQNTVLNKPVVCKYEKNKLGNAVVFVTYLPAN